MGVECFPTSKLASWKRLSQTPFEALLYLQSQITKIDPLPNGMHRCWERIGLCNTPHLLRYTDLCGHSKLVDNASVLSETNL